MLYHLSQTRNIVAGKLSQPIDTTGAGDVFVGGLL
ncbi:hypothetical protein SC936_09095 [Aggregatibacter actinomycetemcomitans serotype e str. SC936]|nr:hypothetical protein SA3096_09580 [Aggregatibacter actinomycetemcomitans serotype e str. SA3096]KYK78708.1 hypothetical protein SC936_09095 [Aggregatibacter actinomycetemcomitans serotype e str. SC936]KYK91872.1 hypothetical protein ANH9776_10060 [Aggregatibacter actinomycetemcomitans serotype e str. ANH9776]